MSAACPGCPWLDCVSGVETSPAADVFAQHHERLVRYLARFTGDADQAADIAQETFVRFLERAPDHTFAAPWLFRVATNLALDAARMQTRRRRLIMRAPAALTHADPPPSPDRDIDRSAARAVVNLALDRLSPHERTALLMREEGFTHREIAEAVGTTTGSVGTLIARALRKAAARLRQAEEAS
jgi:RNA polymerase sigma factor (sigma-70 family)